MDDELSMLLDQIRQCSFLLMRKGVEVGKIAEAVNEGINMTADDALKIALKAINNDPDLGIKETVALCDAVKFISEGGSID